MLHLMELHDQFYLGDAHKHLGNQSIAGKFSKFMYDNVSPQGLIDKQLPKLTNGSFTPHQSKFTGGERVGGTLPLTLSETSTEVIGGIYGSAFAKAKARLQVLGIRMMLVDKCIREVQKNLIARLMKSITTKCFPLCKLV